MLLLGLFLVCWPCCHSDFRVQAEIDVLQRSVDGLADLPARISRAEAALASQHAGSLHVAGTPSSALSLSDAQAKHALEQVFISLRASFASCSASTLSSEAVLSIVKCAPLLRACVVSLASHCACVPSQEVPPRCIAEAWHRACTSFSSRSVASRHSCQWAVTDSFAAAVATRSSAKPRPQGMRQLFHSNRVGEILPQLWQTTMIASQQSREGALPFNVDKRAEAHKTHATLAS